MIKKIKIGKLRISFVLRHKWEKTKSRIDSFRWRGKEIGIFYRKNMCVGNKLKGRAMFSDENMVPSYQFGIVLVWVKCWIDIDWGVLDVPIY
jgi:hypothetical protein